MIHVVTKNKAASYAPQFEAMHGLLHKIYATRRGWPVELNDGIYTGSVNSDLPDPTLSIYLMRICDKGSLSAALRLSPSEFRGARSVQPDDLGLAGLPAGPDIWDAGKVCLDDQPDKQGALTDLALGTLEFALTWSIKQICFLLDQDLSDAARYLPLHMEFAGAPVNFYGETFTPTVLQISPDSVRSLRDLLPDTRPRLHLG
ncbi:MAG: hypothetical protein RLN89_13130 [Parvibaculum sp.]